MNKLIKILMSVAIIYCVVNYVAKEHSNKIINAIKQNNDKTTKLLADKEDQYDRISDLLFSSMQTMTGAVSDIASNCERRIMEIVGILPGADDKVDKKESEKKKWRFR